MDQADAKLNVMLEILQKKIDCLLKIEAFTSRQNQALQEDDDAYYQILKDKQVYVDEVLRLDDIFNRMYKEVKEEVREYHKPKLDKMRDMIKQVMDLDVAIRVGEQKNKKVAIKPVKRIAIPKANPKQAIGAYMKQKKGKF